MNKLRSRLEYVLKHAQGKHAEVVESFLSFYNKKGHISPAQESYFENIEKYYTPAALGVKAAWHKGYSDYHRDVAVKCAKYYAKTMYFQGLVQKVLSDPQTHFLTERQFNKMCNNKYALKILKEYDSPPAFKKGEFVQVRAQSKLPLERDSVAVIIESDAAPITVARKGARVYSILPVGATSLHLAHESELKKARKFK